jgi:hypothetical protein
MGVAICVGNFSTEKNQSWDSQSLIPGVGGGDAID